MERFSEADQAQILEHLKEKRAEAKKQEHRSEEILAYVKILKEAKNYQLETLPEVLIMREELAELYFLKKLFALAIEESCIVFRERVKGRQPYDLDVMTARLNLVRYLTAAKELDTAEEVALRGNPYKNMSDISPVRIFALEPLAKARLDMGLYDNSLKLYEIILWHGMTVHGKLHAATVGPRWGLASALYGLGYFNDARRNAVYNVQLLQNAKLQDEGHLARHEEFVRICEEKAGNSPSTAKPTAAATSNIMENPGKTSTATVGIPRSLTYAEMAAKSGPAKSVVSNSQSFGRVQNPQVPSQVIAGPQRHEKSTLLSTKDQSGASKSTSFKTASRISENRKKQSMAGTTAYGLNTNMRGQPSQKGPEQPLRGATKGTQEIQTRIPYRVRPNRSPASRSLNRSASPSPNRTAVQPRLDKSSPVMAHFSLSSQSGASNTVTESNTAVDDISLSQIRPYVDQPVQKASEITGPFVSSAESSVIDHFTTIASGSWVEDISESNYPQQLSRIGTPVEDDSKKIPEITYQPPGFQFHELAEPASRPGPRGINSGYQPTLDHMYRVHKNDNQLSSPSVSSKTFTDQVFSSALNDVHELLHLPEYVWGTRDTSSSPPTELDSSPPAASLDPTGSIATARGRKSTLSRPALSAIAPNIGSGPTSPSGNTEKKSTQHGSWLDARVHSFQEDGHAKSADEWFDDLKAAQDLVSQGRVNSGDEENVVKICILDTGFDGRHPFLLDAPWGEKDVGERIKGCIWFDQNGELCEEEEWSVWNEKGLSSGYVDQHGHGTHCAGLILRIAPNSHLYIARVVGGNDAGPSSQYIAKAIEYAANPNSKWKGVHIISMSLGFERQKPLEIIQAMNKTAGKALIFAAAANHAAKQENIAFPASASQTICIKSANGYGTMSELSPSNIQDAGRNFSSLGEGVLSMWPMTDEPNTLRILQKRRSGTSVATPIAAACVALLMEFIRQDDELKSTHLAQSQRMLTANVKDSIERILMDEMSVRMGDCRFIRPWKLLMADPGSDSNDRREVASRIFRCLNSH